MKTKVRIPTLTKMLQQLQLVLEALQEQITQTPNVPVTYISKQSQLILG